MSSESGSPEPSWGDHSVQLKKYKDAERDAAVFKKRGRSDPNDWIAHIRSSSQSRLFVSNRSTLRPLLGLHLRESLTLFIVELRLGAT